MVLDLLGRHVGRGADAGHCRLICRTGDCCTKVGNLDVHILGHENIGRFDVTVQHAHLACKVERARAFENHLDYHFNRQQVCRVAVALQRCALDILHHDVFFEIFRHRVVNRGDVRVNQLARERGFGDEELFVQVPGLFVRQRFGAYALDRHFAIVKRVLAQVNDAGCTFAKLAQNGVFANFFHDKPLI